YFCVMKNLQHKAVLVTGGSRGIGAAIALRLARAGADVAITYQVSEAKAEQVVREIRKHGGKALAIQADSANPQDVVNGVNQVYREFNGLHILVNNAGIGLYNDISQFTLEDFDRIMAI